MSQNPKRVEFIGSHPNLVTGYFYTVSEYAAVNDVPVKTMCGRLSRHYKVTDKMLLPARKFEPISNLETDSERLSASWLTKKL